MKDELRRRKETLEEEIRVARETLLKLPASGTDSYSFEDGKGKHSKKEKLIAHFREFISEKELDAHRKKRKTQYERVVPFSLRRNG